MNAEEFAKSIDDAWCTDDVDDEWLRVIESAIESILERMDQETTEQFV